MSLGLASHTQAWLGLSSVALVGLGNMARLKIVRNVKLIDFGRSKRVFPQFKDTHSENTPSNKTQALTKSMNMGIWVVGTSNQLFIRGSCTETNLYSLVTGKNPFFVMGSYCVPHSVFLNIGF